MEEEDIAFKLVELYVRDVSKGHEKRQMGLDTIMNAYFYALLRIARKQKEMEALTKAVEKEEKLLEETADQFVPTPASEQFDFD